MTAALDTVSNFRHQWEALRQVVQAASIAWVVHSTPEISQQAGALLRAFDSAAILYHLPSPSRRPALCALLPQHWASEPHQTAAMPTRPVHSSPTTSASVHTSPPIVKSLEDTLDRHYDELFPSISLCWTQLARQVSSGPCVQGDDPNGTDAMLLWSAQLQFVCRFAREPLSIHYKSHGIEVSSVVGSSVKPLHDRHTNTHGAMERDVEQIIAQCLRWIVSPAIGKEMLLAVLRALRVAHPSLSAMIITQLKLAAMELHQNQAPRGLSVQAIFSLGHQPKPPNDSLTDMYFQPPVIRMLAETYGKLSARDLAQRNARGHFVHHEATSVLEQLCRLWIRERSGLKVASLTGTTLVYAAQLITSYLRFLTVR